MAASNFQIDDDSHIIVKEMRNSVELDKDVKTDCWINIVDKLKRSTNIIVDPYHDQFTAGANFCNSLEMDQKQALAIGLLRCHLNLSHQSNLFPDNCEEHSASARSNNMQSCLSTLGPVSFLMYTQFFQSTEQMCAKLTDDLRIHLTDLRIHRTGRVLDRVETSMNAHFESVAKFTDRFEELDDNVSTIERKFETMDEKIDTMDGKMESMITRISKKLEERVSLQIERSKIFRRAAIHSSLKIHDFWS